MYKMLLDASSSFAFDSPLFVLSPFNLIGPFCRHLLLDTGKGGLSLAETSSASVCLVARGAILNQAPFYNGCDQEGSRSTRMEHFGRSYEEKRLIEISINCFFARF